MMLGHSGKAIVLLLAGAPVAQAGFVFETVVLEGQPATGGLVYGLFERTSITPSGEIVFNTLLRDPPELPQENLKWAVFAGAPDATQLRLAVGDAIPGANDGSTVTSLHHVMLGDSGRLIARVEGSEPWIDNHRDYAVLSIANGADQTILRRGMQVPGAPHGVLVGNPWIGTPTRDGRIAAVSSIMDDGPSGLPKSVALEQGGALTSAFFHGDALPAVGDGISFRFATSFAATALNDAGDLFVGAKFQGPGLTGVTGYEGLLKRSADGAVSLVYRSGDSAPGLPEDTYLGEPTELRANAAGDLLVHTAIQHKDYPDNHGYSTLLAITGGTKRVICTPGAQAPGMPEGVELGGTQFFNSVALGESGVVAFGSRLSGPGIFDPFSTAIYAGKPDALSLLDLVAYVSDIAVTSADRVVYLGGGNMADPAGGLFTFDDAGALLPIVQVTDLFEVAPGDIRTVKAIGQDGSQPLSIADDGTTVLLIEFTDGSSGVFTVQVPAPGAGLALLIPAGALLASRRRPAQPA